ncbi:MAG: hypothetical protein ACI9W4_002627, partial [Rhodothermales bacterium]
MRAFSFLILFLFLSLPVSGQAIMGSLDQGDSAREGGERFDVHTIQ